MVFPNGYEKEIQKVRFDTYYKILGRFLIGKKN